MRCQIIFILTIIIIASSRSVPEKNADISDDFVVSQKNNSARSSSNAGVRDSNEHSCVDGDDIDCKKANQKPPQIPQLTTPNDEPNWLRSPYEVNPYANSATLGVGVGSHGGVLYPYAHPSLFAALNPAKTVLQLPPVFTTQLRDSPPSGSYTLPRNRFARGDEEYDFLDQLSHDAIMPNILPTMPIPMVRSAYGHQIPLIAPAIAVYPANVGSCGIPILLSCSPHISRGIIEQVKYRKGDPKDKQKDTKGKLTEHGALVLPENVQQ